MLELPVCTCLLARARAPQAPHLVGWVNHIKSAIYTATLYAALVQTVLVFG